MTTPYFSKKLIHLLNVTRKILSCQNLNLISSGWNTKLFMQLKSTQYLPLPQFCQKPSCELPSRTRPSIIKLKTNSTWLEITHAMDMILLYNHKLFLKIAAPKRQAKSLKTTFEVVRFYCICKLYTWNLWKAILSQAFLKGFTKIACDVKLYGIVRNLIIYFAETFQCLLMITIL